MEIRSYDQPLATIIEGSDNIVDERAKTYMAAHEGADYLTAVREVLRDDVDLARKYYQRPAPVEDDTPAKEARSYTAAMSALTAEAEDFSLMHNIPFDLAFKRTICRPENRLLTRMYLEGPPSQQRGDD